MDGTTFDSLGFSKKLIEAGFTQQQAEGLARSTLELENIRKAEQEKRDAERKAEQEKLEAERLKTLATKADVEKVRADLSLEIEKVRASIKDTEMRLLRWQIGIGIVLVGIMAKGFGWLGF